MKKTCCFVLVLVIFGCNTTTNLSPRQEEIVIDAWIKSPYKVRDLDSLVVRTPKKLRMVTAIPFSDSIKFTIRTAEREIIFLESKNQKIAFNVNTSQWGKLKPLK